MNGTVMGGVLALLYFLIFQVCGVLLASCLFKDEHLHVRAVLGSAAGSVLLMWLPVLFAFFFDFTLLSHILALLLLLLLTAGICVWKKPAPVKVKGSLLSLPAVGYIRHRAGFTVAFVCRAPAAQLQNGRRGDMVQPVYLRGHEHAFRLYHEHCRAADLPAGIFHFAGGKAILSVFV